jgi:hypothetical protein
MKKYSPAELAVLLEAEGLTKNFMDLRIYACGSGVEINSTASFAQHLSREMRARGYRSIRVTGYLGLVKSSYSYRAIPPYGLDQTDTKHKGVYSPEIAEHFPASTRKVTF